MAINIPIVTEFVDNGLKSAQGAFDNFRMKVGEAEGGMAKFKAGGAVALDALKANALTFAAAAGTAIAGFAVKAVGEFQDLALEVDKFSNSTGLAAEEASRWVEVAGDIGIESGTLLSTFNRLNRAVSENSTAFQELGVEVVRTSTGATDVNATFLKTIDALGKIEDPAKRAELATKLLGRGWTEVSELVEMGSTKLGKALEDVAGAKLIDEQEITKAKEFRAAQDNLNDSIEEFTLVVGQKLIPAFTKVIDGVTPVVSWLGKFQDSFDWWDLTGVGIIENVSSKMSDWFGDPALEDMIDKLKDLEDQTSGTVDMTDDLAVAWRDGTRALINAQYELDGTNDLINGQATLVEDLEYAWQELLGELNQREAWRNLNDRFEEANRKMAEVFGQKGPEAIAKIEVALDEQIEAIARFVIQMQDMIPDDVEVQILTLLDQGKVNEAKAELERIFGEPIYQDIIPNPFTPGALAPRIGGGGRMRKPPRDNGSYKPGQDPMADISRDLQAGLLAVGGRRENGTVIVNVGGSVISEKDLVERIRKGLVDSQRNGAQLIYQNT